jgi:two-component system, LytTR family, sensor kinase
MGRAGLSPFTGAAPRPGDDRPDGLREGDSGGADLRATIGFAVAIWTLFSVVYASALFWEVRTHGHSPPLILLFVLLAWYGWAAATPLVAWLGRRAPLIPFSFRATLVHAVAALVLGSLHQVWWTALVVWLRPFDDMGATEIWPTVVKELGNRTFFEAMIYFAVLGTTYAADYQRRLRAREVAALQLERSLAHASLHALELQVQPHFLFNTLHAIGGLVRKGRGEEAVEMIAGLSDLLRYSLDHAGKHLVPLEREIDVLGRYLAIQRIRFSDRLRVEIDAPEEVRRALVPALILQPLAENAIRHGIEPSSAPGVIELSVRRDGDQLRIEIYNSGPPVHAPRPGIGLGNTRARLSQLYGAGHTFTLENARAGVIARIITPFEEER